MHDCDFHDAPFNPHFQPCADHECCTDAYARSISQSLPARANSNTMYRQPMHMHGANTIGSMSGPSILQGTHTHTFDFSAPIMHNPSKPMSHTRDYPSCGMHDISRPTTSHSVATATTTVCKADQNTPPSGPLTCNWATDDGDNHICTLTFPTPAALQDHYINTHIAPLTRTTLFCRHTSCSRTLPFTQKGKLIRHMCAHSLHRAFQCPHCPSTHTTKEQLKNHISTHTKEKPYKCPVCGRGSGTKTQHENHVRTHTREKPFVCQGCGGRWADSSNLSKHVRRCHPEIYRVRKMQQIGEEGGGAGGVGGRCRRRKRAGTSGSVVSAVSTDGGVIEGME
ncbi:hypothetical protein LTS18_007739 [Coniosporium uncinatum]|uniref:Uncharacterized protein n=1 Tax=Coniosporium uncinatum TaxID=93489 RepID=A0ACC3D275_9PEZI|nr:hypothetical protein LTS18_007739 [Coniosporium uncinatum]